MDSNHKQVFLGGASGRTTWRQRIAIPALEAAGVGYYDPQLGIGEWTTAREDFEMQAKAAAEVLLFVINQETRGVASVAEVGYFIGSGRRLALAVSDIGADDTIDGEVLSPAGRDDLNRGRIFVRSMAAQHGVPVFRDVESAVRHAIQLVRATEAGLSVGRLRATLADIRFRGGGFLCEEIEGGFLIQLRCDEVDPETGARQTWHGRKWHIPATATESDVVRTAFKAAVTWQEHEAREAFTYRGSSVFGAHCDVDDLVRMLQARSARTR
jgi:hypothetical protein